MGSESDFSKDLTLVWFYAPCFSLARRFITPLDLTDKKIHSMNDGMVPNLLGTRDPLMGLHSWITTWGKTGIKENSFGLSEYRDESIFYFDHRYGLVQQDLNEFLFTVIITSILAKAPQVLSVNLHEYSPDEAGSVLGLPITALLPTPEGWKIRKSLVKWDGPVAIPWQMFNVFLSAFPSIGNQFRPIVLSKSHSWFHGDSIQRLSPSGRFAFWQSTVEENLLLGRVIMVNAIKHALDKRPVAASAAKRRYYHDWVRRVVLKLSGSHSSWAKIAEIEGLLGKL